MMKKCHVISKIFQDNHRTAQKNINFYRLLSTQAVSKPEQKYDNITVPYEDIPGPTRIQFLKWYIPGGKLYNKPITTLHETLNQKYGDIAKLPGMFGRKDLIITFRSNDFEKVFRSEGTWPVRPGIDSIAYYRRVLRKDVYGDAEGLATSNGEEWGRFRSVANPVLMQPKTIKTYVPRMNDVASDLIEKIRFLRDTSTLEVTDDFLDHITNWTLESVCVVALDTKLNLIKDPTRHPDALKLKEALHIFFDMVFKLDFEPSIWKLVATPNFKKLIKALDTMTEITQKYTEEACKNMNENLDDNRDISERSVIERLSYLDKNFGTVMAMDLLIAGVDTTSSAFVACLTCLAKNPEKQEILRQEILHILPEKDSPMTSENMKNLPYLRACIKEGLRIHPVTSGNLRALPQDIILGRYQIPKNTNIFMPFTLMFRDDMHFVESNKFIPERWLRKSLTESSECPYSGGQGRSSSPFAYLPFGFGPRMCIGKRLVDLELEIGLAKIIRNFKVEYNYSDKDMFKTNVINIPKVPLKYKFIEL